MNVPIRLGDTAFMCFCYYKRWNRTNLLRAVLFDTTLLSLGAACTTRYTTLQWKFATFPEDCVSNHILPFFKPQHRIRTVDLSLTGRSLFNQLSYKGVFIILTIFQKVVNQFFSNLSSTHSFVLHSPINPFL